MSKLVKSTKKERCLYRSTFQFLNHGFESELLECNLITKKSISFVVFELHEFAPEIIYPIFGSIVCKLKVIISIDYFLKYFILIFVSSTVVIRIFSILMRAARCKFFYFAV